jgi:hypothetical protein
LDAAGGDDGSEEAPVTSSEEVKIIRRSLALDVFSLGAVLIEIFLRRMPYSTASTDLQVRAHPRWPLLTRFAAI